MAAVPVPASPVTRISGSDVAICFSPSRTIGWSSTMNTRIVAERDSRRDDGASLAADDFNRSFKNHRALFHADQSIRIRSGAIGIRDALSIVLYYELKGVFTFSYRDFDPGRTGMARHVAQRLLENPEGGDGDGIGHLQGFRAAALGPDARPVAEFGELSGDGRGETHFADPAGAQLRNETHHRVHGRIDQRQKAVGHSLWRLHVPGQVLQQLGRVDLERG